MTYQLRIALLSILFVAGCNRAGLPARASSSVAPSVVTSNPYGSAPVQGLPNPSNPYLSSQGPSAGQWWERPYPVRFDPKSLSAAQSQLSVRGNHIANAEGEQVILRGVSIADPDKLTFDGEWSRALFEEIANWGANAVRLPIHPLPWRRRGKDWYLSRVDEAVRWANGLQLYLIIDWHSIGNLKTEMFQHPMYETTATETAAFWRSIAFRYKDVPTLAVYELFNEPTDNFIGNGSGSLGKVTWHEWAGMMEDLVDLIRGYNPSAIPLVAGLDWAYDLTPVRNAPLRREGVAYAIHPYPQKEKPKRPSPTAFRTLWQKKWGFVAERHPLIATEWGWARSNEQGAHVPAVHDQAFYGRTLVDFMAKRGISWTAWCLDPDWAPTLITNWDYELSEQGAFIKSVLQTEER